ncbi:MAG: hypothetical protein NUV65_04865 [Candidatus Roizmanbacteria bacterium]|nr:hypothetical protein [Candidatus Roizmanbacteria bacterium]
MTVEDIQTTGSDLRTTVEQGTTLPIQIEAHLVLAHELCQLARYESGMDNLGQYDAAIGAFQRYADLVNASAGVLPTSDAVDLRTEVLNQMYALNLIPPEQMPLALRIGLDEVALKRAGKIVPAILDKLTHNCPVLVGTWDTRSVIEQQLIIEALYQERVDWQNMDRIRLLYELFVQKQSIENPLNIKDKYKSAWILLDRLGINILLNERQAYNRNVPGKNKTKDRFLLAI